MNGLGFRAVRGVGLRALRGFIGICRNRVRAYLGFRAGALLLAEAYLACSNP